MASKMMNRLFLVACFLLENASLKCEAFGTPSSSLLLRSSLSQPRSSSTRLSAEEETVSPVDDYDLLPPEDGRAEDSVDDTDQKEKASASLKSRLYQLAASYDRGFGATPKARNEADDIIQQLATLNPTENSAKGIDGDGGYGEEVPLKAIWRMVWTSAFDVVSLGASPFAGKFCHYELFVCRSC